MFKIKLKTFIISQIKKQPKLVELLVKAANKISNEPKSSRQAIFLEYPVNSKQRWDKQNPNPYLYDIINQNRESYKSELHAFLELSKYFIAIPKQHKDYDLSNEPCWINGWMPALDGVALYGFIVKYKPKLYIEIGSGNSTKFARKAITDHNLGTKIISIDPCPRAEIDEICDEVIRKPVEEVDLEIFDRLHNNDILYIDNSHRVFMNSDVTALFLDVLPRLNPGVLVEIHDITLPIDYPIEWIERYYSEQYILAAYILAKGDLFDIISPNMFISNDKELSKILSPLWQQQEMVNVETHGCSFWLRIK